LIAILAPGNFARASNIEHGIDFSLKYLFKSFLIISKEYILMSKWIFIGSLLCSYCLFSVANSTIKKQINLLQISFLFLVTAFTTIIPFLPLPNAASKHTGAHFQLYLFIGLFILFYYLFSKSNFLIKPLFQKLTMILFLIFSIYIGFKQYFLGKPIKQLVIDRELILKKHFASNDTIYLKSINVPSNLFTNRYWEFDSKEKWAIECMQTYYKTGPIVIFE
jgi:hypothetical protein